MRTTRSKDSLIKELEAISERTHLPLEKRLIDLAIWFHNNKDRIPPSEVTRRADFLEKTLDIQLEIMAMLMQRLQDAEGRSKAPSLWLPGGVDVRGDVKRFG